VFPINGPKAKRSDPNAVPSKGQEIGVEEELLRELGNRYALYRQAISGPFDPVTVLTQTGNVLDTVNRILTSTEHTHGFSPTTRGRSRQ
jgi:hypothetical protein